MQLGKLGVCQSRQWLSRKTGNKRPHSDQWLTSEKQNPQSLDAIVQRGHGLYQIGIGNKALGPSISFALLVATQQSRRSRAPT